MALKFKGVDFIEFDTLLSDDERLVRDNTRRKIVRMKTILAMLLFCGSILAQAQANPDEKRPVTLILTVTGAQGSTDENGKAAEIMGYLSDDPHRRPIPLYCDTPVYLQADGKPKTYISIYCRGEKPACILVHAECPNSPPNCIGQAACFFQPRQ